jgi:hypothetical protein
MAGACPAHRHIDVPRPAPAEPCRHGRSMDGPKDRAAAHHGGYPINYLVAGPCESTHQIRLGARTATPITTTPGRASMRRPVPGALQCQ